MRQMLGDTGCVAVLSLIGIAVAIALAVFVIDTATQINRKERDDER